MTPPPVGTPFEIRYQLMDEDEPQGSYRIGVYSDVAGDGKIAEEILPEARTGNTVAGTPGLIQGLTYDGGRQCPRCLRMR